LTSRSHHDAGDPPHQDLASIDRAHHTVGSSRERFPALSTVELERATILNPLVPDVPPLRETGLNFLLRSNAASRNIQPPLRTRPA
jgi:hypothetical protein